MIILQVWAMRRRYSARFKAEIAQAVLRGDKTIAEIASENGIHPNQINRWKAIVRKGMPSARSARNEPCIA